MWVRWSGRLRRSRSATRCCGCVRDGGGPAGSGDCAGASAGADGGGSGGCGGRGAGDAGATDRRRGGVEALRSFPWAADAGEVAAAVGAGARSRGRDSPHRLRRLVERDLLARARVALRGVPGGAAVAAARSADPVRGLRRLAAGVAAGRSARGAAFLLEAQAGGGARRAGAARKSSAPLRAELPRRDGDAVDSRLGGRRDPAARAARRGDALHDAARGLPRAAARATAGRRTSWWALRWRAATAARSRG